MMSGQDVLLDFPDADVKGHESTMDKNLIRSMAESRVISEDSVTEMLKEHELFIHSGGGYGSFQRLILGSMPMNVYSESGTVGTQLNFNRKSLPKETVLKEAFMIYADLSGCIMESVDFSFSILDQSLMTDSFLAQSNFEQASLKGVDFTCTDLKGVSFKDADLTDADFENSDCEGADFTGAILDGATFKGANLKNVKR